ncbi:MAG TPA: cysteine desulfurase family protein [Candidatus Polarisedimenticolia bacterium]|jgi:cysteine desulfurase|nr:cysteine desulfurase family protein [Candidatus Polarisedimenticolia bacterium]
MTRGIYLDGHATTRPDPRVVAAMRPYFEDDFGNASSKTHPYGWRAEEAVTRARSQVAKLIHADPKEILFTSGATESNNLAILGALRGHSERGDHLITAATEHPSVLDVARAAAEQGAEVTILPVDGRGRVDPDRVRAAITARTVLVSIMAANNEVGTLGPIAAIGALCKERGVLFHTDAAQAIGKIPIDVLESGVDLLSISAHKIHGPKGVGALYVRRKNPRVLLRPMLFGGGQEKGLRPGTLNVPGIVGLGMALEIARNEMAGDSKRLAGLRDRLQKGFLDRITDLVINGDQEQRLPNNLNVSFSYVEGEALLLALDGVAVSSGSACTSEKREPSHVLKAMGVSDTMAQTSLRFGLGRFNTEAEVDAVVERVAQAVVRLREISPLAQAAKAEGTEMVQSGSVHNPAPGGPKEAGA